MEYYDLYKITNTITDKIYIGWTSKGYLNRWNTHKEDSKGGKTTHKFYNALRKYGFDVWNIELIYIAFSQEEAKRTEIEFIDYYDSYRNGYNTTLGGDGISGYHHTTETKKRIADAGRGRKMTDDNKRKLIEISTGREVSEKTRKRISDSLMGSHHTEETKKRMSEGRLGENNNFFGKTHSVESRNLQRTNHPRSKSVMINNVVYNSINEAASTLGITWYAANNLAVRI